MMLASFLFTDENIFTATTVKNPQNDRRTSIDQKETRNSFLRDYCRYCELCTLLNTRMWANAQRDGRHVEYRWRSPLNAAQFG